jgi:hypothetical protein
LCVAIALIALVALPLATANASHIPVALDIAALWSPIAPDAGVLNFVEPGPAFDVMGLPLGISGTEEYTGWVDSPAAPGATGATLDLGPLGGPPAFAFDNGVTHGDRVDFDFVVENRPVEVGAIAPAFAPLHPGTVGFMTWDIAPTTPSAHIDPLTGAPHGHGTPSLPLPDFGGPVFRTADVFSISANPADATGLVTDFTGLVSDGELLPRDQALDYMLDFCNDMTGLCAPGVPILVFAPGWSPGDIADDFVARWLSPFPATHVLIDPVGPAEGHDEITQIDAVVVSRTVPEPVGFMLLGWLGLAGLLWRQRTNS